MISFVTRGSFGNLERSLKAMQSLPFQAALEAGGQMGVDALAAATRTDTGLAAQSWGYEISQNGSGFTITWTNADVENGFPVAIMLQYGYATGTGGYVQGMDYINPAMRPVFAKIQDTIWKAVKAA